MGSRSAQMHPQLPLFISQAPFSDMDTSLEAARAITPHLANLERQVLDYLTVAGTYGACDHEVQEGLRLGGSTVRPRRVALVGKGLVRWAGKYRLTPAGRRAKVWESAARTQSDKETT